MDPKIIIIKKKEYSDDGWAVKAKRKERKFLMRTWEHNKFKVGVEWKVGIVIYAHT